MIVFKFFNKCIVGNKFNYICLVFYIGVFSKWGCVVNGEFIIVVCIKVVSLLCMGMLCLYSSFKIFFVNFKVVFMCYIIG